MMGCSSCANLLSMSAVRSMSISGMLGCPADGTNVGDIWNGVSWNTAWSEISALFTLDVLLFTWLTQSRRGQQTQQTATSGWTTLLALKVASMHGSNQDSKFLHVEDFSSFSNLHLGKGHG